MSDSFWEELRSESHKTKVEAQTKAAQGLSKNIFLSAFLLGLHGCWVFLITKVLPTIWKCLVWVAPKVKTGAEKTSYATVSFVKRKVLKRNSIYQKPYGY